MPLKLDKKEVAAVLDEIGTLLELKGENPFRCRAYHTAARALSGMAGELGEYLEEKKLTEIKGIGEDLAEKIVTLATTGKLPYHEKLKSSIPAGLVEMLKIPGLGPKKAKALYERLKTKSVEELEKACQAGRLRDLEGFGEKTEENILRGIEFVKRTKGVFLFSEALAEGERIYRALKDHPQILRLSLAGSLRRRKEIIRDLDLVASSNNPGPVMEAFVNLPGVAYVNAQGETKSSVLLTSGMQADLRVVRDVEFPYALHYFTGSKEHNIAMRSRAIKMGMTLNEYGLFKGEKAERLVRCKDEAALFKALGLLPIPPELREDTGEIEAAERGTLPDLVEPEEIRGTFHVHSTYSDGVNTLEELAQAGKKLGYHYLGIADHSKSAYYAGGLKEPDLEKQHAEIEALNRKLRDMVLLKGVEVDILPDGRLDFEDEVLKRFDFVIASVHSVFTLSKKEMTQRVLKAIQNPYVTMLGHPTGRLLLSRDPYEIDLEAVIEAAARTGTMIEINAHPLRLDLDWRMARLAKEAGVMIAINPDAHNIEGLKDVLYGVYTARRGWLEAGDILNTRDVDEVRKILRN